MNPARACASTGASSGREDQVAKQDEGKTRKPAFERRRHPVGTDPRYEARAERADERAARRAKRSNAEQLDALNARPGEARRERGRLA